MRGISVIIAPMSKEDPIITPTSDLFIAVRLKYITWNTKQVIDALITMFDNNGYTGHLTG
jgi:hypothetical protein